ncbi:UDP-N-acetylglucosamine 2-epimerase [Sporosarcina gallistercoris]|uniref:UDP-N-acetylglucosamine 2-epimerase (Hydrolyzing) n=1 Tax=Sporosarcina gallistercoris TaxID=2762245 RepID=A0ABR8PN80_9BACL|nr:UDP-N-acetylglucosamine 2-epimerase [Sporosarcina gallistercoris]MBD7909614.1 UDP-N-acetylglucosamine 2-epimerase (hydrolyzing) [Sporosarcina gallistercoris]
MSIKKIVAFTGIRSDYDLLSGLYKKINNNPDLDIKLIVSGSHMSSTYGGSVSEIIKDGIPILAKTESLLDSNSPSVRVKSLSILLLSVVHTIVDYNPDLIIVAGDREDVMAGSLVGAYLEVPVAHFFGGDHAKDGNVDNPIRHATSMLANIHFVTNENSELRLLKIGEERRRIFNIGSPSLDKFLNTEEISKEDLFEFFNIEYREKYALLIFHPVIDRNESASMQFQKILNALQRKGIFTFVSYPNTDSGNKLILDVISNNIDNPNFYFYKNLDRPKFINLFRNAEFLIGNSSAGIYEAPFLKKPVINVGIRQKGRLSAENVVFIDNSEDSIVEAIEKVESADFKKLVDSVQSPYGDGNSEDLALDLIKTLDFEEFKLKTNDPLEVNNE